MCAALRISWLLRALIAAVLAGAALTLADPAHAAASTAASHERLRQAVKPAQPLPPQDLLFASPTTLDHVGRVVAAVMVDGKGPFRFIIDTGANRSTISPRLVAALGLTPSASEPMRVAGVTGTAIEPSVHIESLRAGALVITHTSFPVIWSPIMAGADGILGAAGLASASLLVDFRHNSVVIRRAHEDAIPRGYVRMSATRLSGGLLSIPGYVGDVAVDAIIDTGSPQTLGNRALFRALYSHPKAGGKSGAVSVYGATKQVRPGEVLLAPALDLGQIWITNAPLVYGDFPIFNFWGLTARPAIILGMDVLGTLDAFCIDFRHAEIGVVLQGDQAPPSVSVSG
ncbi:MAG: retroviral-like aspartic protease family protein [Steroidobacteraceae bacterium]